MTTPRPRGIYAAVTRDGDTRQLVTRCALLGIPAAVIDDDGVLRLVRNLDDLDRVRT